MFGVHSEVFTDHQSLRYLILQKDLNLRQTIWLQFLKDYDINFQYHPGKANVVVETLSHRPYSAVNCLIELPVDLCEEFSRI